ncbi:hypothetical protein [Devosia aurantiaca]|nr:hypothetical protein [Devosia aurantiaca]
MTSEVSFGQCQPRLLRFNQFIGFGLGLSNRHVRLLDRRIEPRQDFTFGYLVTASY